MIVSKIQVNKKNKNIVDVYFDNDICYSLQTEILVKHNIQVGTKLSEFDLFKCAHESKVIECSQKATKYVSKALKTEHQVRIYLIKNGYENVDISQAIEKLKEYKLIDDKKYMKAYIHDHKDYGEKLLRQELLNKGVDWKLIREYFEYNYKTDIQHLQKLADKYMKSKEKTYSNIQKCKQYLLNKGFAYEEIKQINWEDYEEWVSVDEDWN